MLYHIVHRSTYAITAGGNGARPKIRKKCTLWRHEFRESWSVRHGFRFLTDWCCGSAKKKEKKEEKKKVRKRKRKQSAMPPFLFRFLVVVTCLWWQFSMGEPPPPLPTPRSPKTAVKCVWVSFCFVGIFKCYGSIFYYLEILLVRKD